MFQFEPIEEEQQAEMCVPFLEDARADYAPYYDPRDWSVGKAQAAVSAEFSKLGAGITRFQEGNFTIHAQMRRGYNIEFVWNGVKGRIVVAGLPIQMQATEKKLQKAKIQALLNVRDWIKAAVTARIFSPGEHPLVPHLILEDGRTIAEQMMESMGLPQLPTGSQVEVIDGEVIKG
jgi:hypothetical protein